LTVRRVLPVVLLGLHLLASPSSADWQDGMGAEDLNIDEFVEILDYLGTWETSEGLWIDPGEMERMPMDEEKTDDDAN